ncbi:sel1 repeat family protein [Vibrio scophthalmi]|uniref:sel1 repeat family protein n=1 Tax=Vibrio scophthalmi TaxID=45658 RepID=UPI002283E1AB|nr:sel1 repeat family protein [Vibrio scophthalmi]MCY9801948.1 sel1 repeat family protein [Vibrio scophthalmi]
MKWLNYRFILVAFVFCFSSLLHANQPIYDLTPEQAYQQGMLLYQQNKYTQARPLLKHAANRGYPAAALMYADTFYANLFIQTEQESEYIVKAAEMGSIIGMLRTGGTRAINEDRRLWKVQASRVLNNLADQGNPFAMQLLSASVDDRGERSDWLKKAAEAGDAYSQHKLAKRYENGYDWFLIPGKREKETERLFKAAADSGYWLGMLDYADRLKKRGNIKGYQSIIDELVEAGDALSILGISGSYVDAREYELAAYYSKIYLDSMGNEGKQSGYKAAQSIYDEATLPLTTEQIKQVDLKVQQYLKTHTVRYQKRIKDYEYTLDSFQ